MSAGYATVSLDDAGPTGVRRSVTDALGCASSTVDVYRLPADEPVWLEADPEQLCVPIEGTEPLLVGADAAIPPSGIGRLPAGVEAPLDATEPTDVVVIGAPAEPALDADPVVLDLDTLEFTAPSTSDIETARLTAPLGAVGMKVNARRLHPDQRVPYHTEGGQEELFVPVRGPASMRLDGEAVKTPVGTVTRVAPPVPRSAVNDGEMDARWLMVGAPPTGAPDEWDPGAEILE